MTDIEGVSIIVCTFNGSKRLSPVIKCIANQIVHSNISWELIVVDNASTDNTSAVASSLWREFDNHSAEFRIIEEPTPGVTNARNAGIKAAKYECLIFCDDDNYLATDFIQKAFEILNGDKKIAAIGSNGQAIADIAIPPWFYEYRDYYATGPQGENNGDITSGKGFVYGAGSVFRKSALMHIRENGFTNQIMSKTGKSLLTGEDNEYCYALIMSGYKIWYDESLRFNHYMPAERLTMRYFTSLVKAYAYSNFLTIPYLIVLGKHEKPDFKYGAGWNIMLQCYLFLRHDIPFFFKYIFSSERYKIKLQWMIRVGTLQAIMDHPGYQLKLINLLKTAQYLKRD